MPVIALPARAPTSDLALVHDDVGQLLRLDLHKLGLGVPVYSYDPEGVLSEAEIDLVELLADRVGTLYSFELDHTLADGTVGVRFSLDGGASFLYWDGAAWSAATLPAHWTTPDDANEFLPSLPYVDRLLTRVLLTPEEPLAPVSPTVAGARVMLHYRGLAYLEDLERSMRDRIEAAGSLQLVFSAVLAAEATVSLPSSWLVDTDALAARVEAFNVTDDPDKSANLAASVAGTVETLESGRAGYRSAILTLTGAQTGTVEVTFAGVPLVIVSNDPTCEEPSADVLVRFDAGGARRAPVTCLREDWGTRVSDLEASVHEGPDLWDVFADVIVQSTVSDRVVAILEDAIGKALSRGAPIRSLGGGFCYHALDYNQGISSTSRVGEGLYTRAARVRLGVPRWVTEPNTVGLVAQIEALVAVGVSEPRGAEGVLIE